MIALLATLALTAPTADCPSAATIAQQLPPNTALPTDVSINHDRLLLTVVFADGQKRTRRGIRVSSDCEERARTVAAVVRAWHLAWRPAQQKKEKKPRRKQHATRIAKAVTSSVAVAQDVTPKPAVVSPPAAVKTATVAAKPIETTTATVAKLPIRPGARPKPVADQGVAGPVRIVQRVPAAPSKWTAPRWVALGPGLSAVASAVALNVSDTQKPRDVLPLGLYFVGGGVSVATLLAD